MSDGELYPRDLLERLQSGSVTPFVGSGLSMPSGVPGWYDLLGGLLDEMEGNGVDVIQFRRKLQEGQLSAIAAPALFQDLSSKYALKQYVQDRLNHPWEPNAYHESLVALPCDVIITTNWDRLIERAYEEAGIAVQKIWTDAQLAHFNARQAVQVIKIHGTLDDINSIVFAEDEYTTYRQSHKHLYNFLSTVVLTQTLLFLGFSGNDPNVRSLLETITNDLGGLTRAHYAVMYEADRNDIQDLKRLGIRVVNLPFDTDRTQALQKWLHELAERSRIVAKGNKGKASTVNSLIERQITQGTPGAVIRMRAAMGILSNPKSLIAADPLYGSTEQDQLEIEMGNKARQFLRRDGQNQIRCILHINPEHQRHKGYQWRHLERRLSAMLEFLDEFGLQISLAHSPIPIDMNQVIIGRSWSVTSFKRGEAVGYERLAVAGNRWVVDSDIRGFEHDFDGIRELNRIMADTIGIDTKSSDWHSVLSRRIIELALAVSRQQRTVLQCDGDGKVIASVSRDEAHSKAILHRSVHLHVIDSCPNARRILVQRRPKAADLYGGLLDVSVAGHPERDDMLAEVQREAHEELGLDVTLQEIHFFERRHRQFGNDFEVVDIYYIERPGLSENGNLRVTHAVDAIHWIEPVATNERLLARGLVRYGSLEIPTVSTVAVADFVPGAYDELLSVYHLHT